MDSGHGRDTVLEARKRRKGLLASEGDLELKEESEGVHHSLALVEESTENREAEDSEQQRQLHLQRDEGDELEKVPSQERTMSAEMEASIQEIRQRIIHFTQQVSGLLEAVKNFFAETSNAFEERLVLLHQAQIDKWEEEIRLLGMIDSENEEMNYRLSNAQELLSNM